MHPLTGIGLDNFRLTYGRYFNATDLPPGTSWNNTIHTNNWYLETLVSLGIAGALPFFAWSALLLFDIFRNLHLAPIGDRFLPGKSPGGLPAMLSTNVGLPAIAVGLLTYFVHGFLDYFMLFNATALLFWLLVGLWLRESALMLPRS
jgi:O-antigen ligase